MAFVRFVSPIEDLELPGVPAKFDSFIYDIDASDTLALTRMRWQGAPFKVREMGEVGEDVETPYVTESMVVSGISNPLTAIGSAVTTRLQPFETLPNQVAVLRTDVNTLIEAGGGGGAGIVIGTELPSPLESGSAAARLRTY
jgi:hypothetical protein